MRVVHYIKNTKLILASALILANLAAGVLLPVQAYAADPQIRVCGAANDGCSRFVNTYINPFIALLSALVGVSAAISIIYAGILYSSSADDPAKVTQAKTRITQTIIGVLAFIFLVAFLNYLVPGGII